MDDLLILFVFWLLGISDLFNLGRYVQMILGDDSSGGGDPADSESERSRAGEAKIRRITPAVGTERNLPRQSPD